MATDIRSVPPDPIDRLPPHLASMVREYLRTHTDPDIKPCFVTSGKQNLFHDPASDRDLIWKMADGTLVRPRYIELGKKTWKAMVIACEGRPEIIVSSAKAAGRVQTRTQFNRSENCHSAYYTWMGGTDFEEAPSVFKIFPPLPSTQESISPEEELAESSQDDDTSSEGDDRELDFEERARWKPRRLNPLIGSSSSSNEILHGRGFHHTRLGQHKQSDKANEIGYFFTPPTNNKQRLPDRNRPPFPTNMSSQSSFQTTNSKRKLDDSDMAEGSPGAGSFNDSTDSPQARRRALISEMVYEPGRVQPLTPQTSNQTSPARSRAGKKPSPIILASRTPLESITGTQQHETHHHLAPPQNDDLFVDQRVSPEPLSAIINADRDPAGVAQGSLLLQNFFTQSGDEDIDDGADHDDAAKARPAKPMQQDIVVHAEPAKTTHEESGGPPASTPPSIRHVTPNLRRLLLGNIDDTAIRATPPPAAADAAATASAITARSATTMSDHAKAHTFFTFEPAVGDAKRKAFVYCDTLLKLFAQATAAKVFHQPMPPSGRLELRLYEDDILLASIPGRDDRYIPRGDAEAFSELVQDIAGLELWSRGAAGATCEVAVRLT